ncbi:MAG: sulfite exporter TauE/SafE family protein [Hyphomicrobiales bacterium]|nr:sulfite exporter TauE/SafE family protein [Hyphomicrobiales bacterium]
MIHVTAILATLSGSLVGFSLGLIGGGGSILATPLLLYFVGVTPAHTAIGTSAVAVAVNAYVNLIGHARAGNVRWRAAVLFAGVGIVGAFTGSTLGKSIDGNRLLFFFGLLMIAVGALMLSKSDKLHVVERPSGFKADLILAITAFFAGVASGFFGIGGGFLIMPCLVLATGMPTIKAVGTSLFAVGAFGTGTAINYAWSGLIDWPVAIEFIIGGAIGGYFGMKSAVRLADRKGALNKIFACLIFVVAVYVLYRSGRSLLA